MNRITPITGPVRRPPGEGSPVMPSPPIITSPNPITASPGLTPRGVMLAVIQSVDNANYPQFATVLINNKLPGEMGYSLPAGVGPFVAGGTSGPYNYFYNNSQGIGGSFCYVDADAHVVLSFTGNVSTTPPTPFYKALADHLHNGNLNPDSFQNPQPINLSNGEVSSLLPYGNNSSQVQGAVGSDGALLATLFPGQVKQITGGQYAGYFNLLTDTVKTSNPMYVAVGNSQTNCQWAWITWQFQTNYTAANGNYNPTGDSTSYYGPAIWDSNNNIFSMQINNTLGGGAQSRIAVGTGVDPSASDPFLNWLHNVSICMQPLTNGNYNLQWYVDGVLMTGNTPLGLTGQFTPPFYFGWYTNNDTLYPPSGVFAQSVAFGTSMPHASMSPALQTNWDQGGNLLSTGGLQTNTMNSTAYITDFTFHYSLGTSAPYVLTYWYDNGTAGQDAKIYQTYSSQTTNMGHTTSGSPSGTFNTGLSGAGTVYVLVSYTNSVHWTFQTSPFTGSQIQAAYQDGVVALIASLQTSNNSLTVPSGGGGSGSITANGGRAKN